MASSSKICDAAKETVLIQKYASAAQLQKTADSQDKARDPSEAVHPVELRTNDSAVLQLTDSAINATAQAQRTDARHGPVESNLMAVSSRSRPVDDVTAEVHFTSSGCHCLLEWSHEGDLHSGCSRHATTFSAGHPWCEVSQDCTTAEGHLLNGGLWDYCVEGNMVAPLNTEHGCHCASHWKHEGRFWRGCSRTALGPSWCYIFESPSSCPAALLDSANGRPWDTCHEMQETAPYLTQSGCHCMPHYDIRGKEYKGCSRVKLRQDGDPVLVCAVLEDQRGCPGAFPVEGTLLRLDFCDVEDGHAEATLPKLIEASKDCHCKRTWYHEGSLHSGCVMTADKPKPWCYVLEDERLCKEVDGNGTAYALNQRWKYCRDPSVLTAKISQIHWHFGDSMMVATVIVLFALMLIFHLYMRRPSVQAGRQ